MSFSYLFHQNMLNFGGEQNRSEAYEEAFGRLAAALDGPIQVAGFTEITNNRSASIALGKHGAQNSIYLCGALGVTYRATIACRVGARTEFIGIGSKIAPLSYGRIIITWGDGKGGNRGLSLGHDIWQEFSSFEDWCSNISVDLGDYQSIVYIVTVINNVRVGIGFMHNIYSINDNRTALLAGLPRAASRISQNPEMRDSTEVYICGDFNCEPNERNWSNLKMVPYRQGTLEFGCTPFEFALSNNQKVKGKPGGTTMAGSLYDYSFVAMPEDSMVVDGMYNPRIDTRTMDRYPGGKPIARMQGLMSDHVASLLGI